MRKIAQTVRNSFRTYSTFLNPRESLDLKLEFFPMNWIDTTPPTKQVIYIVVSTPLKYITFLGTNISPFQWQFWVDDVPFPKVGYVIVSWRVYSQNAHLLTRVSPEIWEPFPTASLQVSFTGSVFGVNGWLSPLRQQEKAISVVICSSSPTMTLHNILGSQISGAFAFYPTDMSSHISFGQAKKVLNLGGFSSMQTNFFFQTNCLPPTSVNLSNKNRTYIVPVAVSSGHATGRFWRKTGVIFCTPNTNCMH